MHPRNPMSRLETERTEQNWGGAQEIVRSCTSPCVSFPARPARPHICLYRVGSRKSRPMYLPTARQRQCLQPAGKTSHQRHCLCLEDILGTNSHDRVLAPEAVETQGQRRLSYGDRKSTRRAGRFTPAARVEVAVRMFSTPGRRRDCQNAGIPITIEAPAKGRGGISRMAVSPTA